VAVLSHSSKPDSIHGWLLHLGQHRFDLDEQAVIESADSLPDGVLSFGQLAAQ
jgi:hypothetical protein